MQQDISPATGNQAQVEVVCSPDSLLPIPALSSDALHVPLPFPFWYTVTEQCLCVCLQQLLETVRAVFLSATRQECLLCLRIEIEQEARKQFMLAEQRSNPWVQM